MVRWKFSIISQLMFFLNESDFRLVNHLSFMSCSDYKISISSLKPQRIIFLRFNQKCSIQSYLPKMLCSVVYQHRKRSTKKYSLFQENNFFLCCRTSCQIKVHTKTNVYTIAGNPYPVVYSSLCRKMNKITFVLHGFAFCTDIFNRFKSTHKLVWVC